MSLRSERETRQPTMVREDVGDEGDVREASPRRDVGDVRDPKLVGALGDEFAIDQIGGTGEQIVGDGRDLE